MKPSDVTIDEVRNEMQTLIDQHPGRTGAVSLDNEEKYLDGEFTCVYYTDELNRPINTLNYNYSDRPVFKTPVCIIGQWIEDFHPEFKEDEGIRRVLIGNTSLSSAANINIFKEEVYELLSSAQSVQDNEDTVWGDIKL